MNTHARTFLTWVYMPGMRVRRRAAAAAVVATVLLIVALPAPAAGMSFFKSRIPNGDSVPAPEGGICGGVGHTSCGGGGARNPFGIAFKAAGLAWTKELCEADSDGDGAPNGVEVRHSPHTRKKCVQTARAPLWQP